jgi:signal transduction histidine kinase
MAEILQSPSTPHHEEAPRMLRQTNAEAALSPTESVTHPGCEDRRRPSIASVPHVFVARWFRTAASHAVAPNDVEELRESRARIQAAADAERRRIEQNLHDGAQQRLIAIRIHLALAAERVAELDDTAAELLRTLGTDVEDAIDDIRSLAHGVYPFALDGGLVDALRNVAGRSPVPITVRAAGVHRYPREIEEAAYFCSLEAIQNATKHAFDATAVSINLSHASTLDVEIRDNGAGFDSGSVVTGRGLLTMRDRLDAVGGHLTIQSQPGQGTRILASIPLP